MQELVGVLPMRKEMARNSTLNGGCAKSFRNLFSVLGRGNPVATKQGFQELEKCLVAILVHKLGLSYEDGVAKFDTMKAMQIIVEVFSDPSILQPMPFRGTGDGTVTRCSNQSMHQFIIRFPEVVQDSEFNKSYALNQSTKKMLVVAIAWGQDEAAYLPGVYKEFQNIRDQLDNGLEWYDPVTKLNYIQHFTSDVTGDLCEVATGCGGRRPAHARYCNYCDECHQTAGAFRPLCDDCVNYSFNNDVDDDRVCRCRESLTSDLPEPIITLKVDEDESISIHFTPIDLPCPKSTSPDVPKKEFILRHNIATLGLPPRPKAKDYHKHYANWYSNTLVTLFSRSLQATNFVINAGEAAIDFEFRLRGINSNRSWSLETKRELLTMVLLKERHIAFSNRPRDKDLPDPSKIPICVNVHKPQRLVETIPRQFINAVVINNTNLSKQTRINIFESVNDYLRHNIFNRKYSTQEKGTIYYDEDKNEIGKVCDISF
jgi:hypothetical protein